MRMLALFLQEEDFGRARVSMQWGNQEEFITEAVDMCPVDCIHYVSVKPADQQFMPPWQRAACGM